MQNNSSPLRLVVALGMVTACGHSDTPIEVDQTALNEYVAALPPWQQPPADSHLMKDLGFVEREKMTPAGPARFSCQKVQHDVLQSYTSILSLGSSQTNLKPGMLLQGNSYRAGTLQSIPIPRSPATLSIDLPVPTPTVVVESPDSAALQQGVATLQIAASSELTNLPALVAFTKEESSSETEMTLQLGASLSYSSAVASLDFEAAFAGQEAVQKHTIVAKLMQPMYTISFADDAIAEPAKFFASTVTEEDLKTQEMLGTIGPDNLPVFVSSVTYGRMVVFTATSTTASSSSEISAKLDASFGAYRGGAALDQATKNFLSSLEIKVLAIGGDSAAVGNAIVTGDYNSLFGNADATSAVPLKFAVKNLAGTRPPAGIGDALSFVEENCTPITAVGWVEIPPATGAATFQQLSIGKGGQVWAVGDNGTALYHFNGTSMDRVDSGAAVGRFREVAVNDDGFVVALFNDQKVRLHQQSGAGFYPNQTQLEVGSFLRVDFAGDTLMGLGLNSGFYAFDEASGTWQQRAAATAAGSSISMADGGLAWFRGGSVDVPAAGTYTISNPNAVVVQKSSSPAVTPAAASATEVWGLGADFAIRKYNFGASAWELATAITPAIAAPPQPISQFDAGPGANLWIVTNAGKIMHWVP